MPRLSGALAILVATVGCSRPDDRKPVYPVGGKAAFNGEPMSGARITFHPLDDPDQRAVRSMAEVEKDGTYRLTTYLKEDGAPAGEYAVTVYWPDKRSVKAGGPDADANDLPPDRLKRVYATATTTKLRATVREQSNTIDFILP